MTPMIIIVAVLSLLVIYFLMANRSLREDADIMEDVRRLDQEELLDLRIRLSQMTDEAEELAQKRIECAKLARALEEETKKGSDTLQFIERTLQERDTWRDLYYVEAREHGNAQQLFMDERLRLINQLKMANMKPAVSNVLERVFAEYQGKHTVSQENYENAKKNA